MHKKERKLVDQKMLKISDIWISIFSVQLGSYFTDKKKTIFDDI